jgi:hypothetical protein
MIIISAVIDLGIVTLIIAVASEGHKLATLITSRLVFQAQKTLGTDNANVL